MRATQNGPAPQDQGDLAANRKKVLRQAFGSFATGITVVTACDRHGNPVGFTANSFASVSLDPPLLLVCPSLTSSNIETFRNAASFAVNVLGAHQEEISRRFAAPVDDRFAGLHWTKGPQGQPLLDDCAGWFACSRHQVIDAGDHLVLVGKVEDCGNMAHPPLLFHRGQYRQIASVPVQRQPLAGAATTIRVGILALQNGKVLLQRAGADSWEIPLGPARRLFGEARNACETDLAARGLSVTLTHPYSIYDDGEQCESRFLFLADLPPDADLPAGMALFDPGNLPLHQVRNIGMRDVLRRLAQERQRGRFGVFVGNPAAPGRISHITGSSESWPDFFLPEGQPT
ncbi:MAG: flavin reductase family protein [Rhodobacterales bacterium]|nr:flavin reductase family protein [Rhodobacterales bacterium]